MISARRWNQLIPPTPPGVLTWKHTHACHPSTFIQPAWVELTDINIAVARSLAGSPQAMLFQSPKCVFGLIMQPSTELRQKLQRWGTMRAYLVLKLANMGQGDDGGRATPGDQAGNDAFAAHQPKVPVEAWGYYWEQCRCVHVCVCVLACVCLYVHMYPQMYTVFRVPFPWSVRGLDQPTNQPASQPARQAGRQPSSQSTNHPTNQPNQPINPTNQSTQLPTNRPTDRRDTALHTAFAFTHDASTHVPSVNSSNQVQRQTSESGRAQQQVNFSRDQNYHPYVELTGKSDLWFTVWLRAEVAPCFFEIHLEDGSKNTLRVPFIASTGSHLLPGP